MKIKMKDIILEHYQKVHEKEMNGVTVRVYKPKTMQHLPAHDMLGYIRHRTYGAAEYMAIEGRNEWKLGNPDYGFWDAQTVYHYDAHHRVFEIFFAAILVRPFSREAYDKYSSLHENIDDVNLRLMTMFDSREYDRIHGFDTSFGAYKPQDEAYHVTYSVIDEEHDIADTSPSYYLQVVDDDECSPVRRRSMAIRRMPDGTYEYNAVTNGHEPMQDGGTPLMHDVANAFADLEKKHPDVTEMRVYTDELVKVGE